MCTQGVHGWYELLDEERGLTESRAVPATVTKPEQGEWGREREGWEGVAPHVIDLVCD